MYFSIVFFLIFSFVHGENRNPNPCSLYPNPDTAYRRPFYVILKKPTINTLRKGFLDGDNGLLNTVSFGKDGTPLMIGDEEIGSYIEALEDRVNPSSSKFMENFLLLILELELDGADSTSQTDAVMKLADLLLPVVRLSRRKFGIVILVEKKEQIIHLEPFTKNKTLIRMIDGKVDLGIWDGKPTESVDKFSRQLNYSPVWQMFSYDGYSESNLKEAIYLKNEEKLVHIFTGLSDTAEDHLWESAFWKHVTVFLGSGSNGMITKLPKYPIQLMRDDKWKDKLCLVDYQTNPFPIKRG